MELCSVVDHACSFALARALIYRAQSGLDIAMVLTLGRHQRAPPGGSSPSHDAAPRRRAGVVCGCGQVLRHGANRRSAGCSARGSGRRPRRSHLGARRASWRSQTVRYITVAFACRVGRPRRCDAQKPEASSGATVHLVLVLSHAAGEDQHVQRAQRRRHRSDPCSPAMQGDDQSPNRRRASSRAARKPPTTLADGQSRLGRERLSPTPARVRSRPVIRGGQPAVAFAPLTHRLEHALRASTAARSLPDGTRLQYGRRHPCRCAAPCRRRSHGTPRRTGP